MKRNSSNELGNDSNDGKFVVLSTNNEKRKLSDEKMILIKKFIADKIGGYSKLNTLRNGDILVKTNKENIGKLIGSYNFGIPTNDFKVHIKANDKLNQNKGTIMCKRLTQESEEDILELLKDQKVTEVRKMQKRDSEGQLIATGMLILTFSCQKLPDKVLALFYSCTVRQYYDRPLKCAKCQKFGHLKKFCVNKVEVCHQCALPLPHDVHGEDKCINCNGKHASSDRNCPEFKRQNDIKRIQTDNRWPYGKALAEYNKIQQSLEPTTLANVIKSNQAAEMDQLKAEIRKLKSQLDDKDRLVKLMHEKLMSIMNPNANENKRSTQDEPVITTNNAPDPARKRAKHEENPPPPESMVISDEDQGQYENEILVTAENLDTLSKKARREYQKLKKNLRNDEDVYYNVVIEQLRKHANDNDFL